MKNRTAEWDDLATHCAEPNPFFESWYLLPALENLPGSHRVSILCFTRDGHLAGLLPIMRSPRYYGWPLPNMSSWVHDNCFLGVPLVSKGCEQAFWQSVLRWADNKAHTSLFLHLRAMALDGPVYTALMQVLSQKSRPHALVHREERAMLASSLSPQTYLETSLSHKKRKELRRLANRLADEGMVHFERRSDNVGIDAWCHEFLGLEQAGWKGKAQSALACDPATTRLFVRSLLEAAERGRLERRMLSLNGQPIAMLATFLTPPGAFSFKTAFDERYARFSPGVLLQVENLDILERAGIAWTDSCASADHPMIDHLWRERRAIGRVSVAIGGRARRTVFEHVLRAEMARSRQTSLDR